MKSVFAIGLALVMTLHSGCTGFQVLNSTVPRHGYARSSDLSYGNQSRQKLDVYRPKHAPAVAKVVIFFYGGSWRAGNKADYRFVAEALTARGFLVVLPDYRLYPAVTFPAFVSDAAAAVRWTHDNIKTFGGDANCIYLMGHSAGAHIAASLTLDQYYLEAVGLGRTAIRATAGLSGPYDFIPGESDRAVFDLGPSDSPQAIGPINFVDGHAPPMLLIHGLRDQTVEPGNASRLAARIRAAGGEVECIAYPRRAHAAVVMAFAWPFRGLAPVLDDVINYFDEH